MYENSGKLITYFYQLPNLQKCKDTARLKCATLDCNVHKINCSIEVSKRHQSVRGMLYFGRFEFDFISDMF